MPGLAEILPNYLKVTTEQPSAAMGYELDAIMARK